MTKIIHLEQSRVARTRGGQDTGSLRRLAVVTPVLDDWRSLAILVQNIERHVAPEVDWIEIIAVDDGSVEPFDPESIQLSPGGRVRALRIVHLALNLGHQRAIAVGLVKVAAREDLQGVIVMDCDGEDRPEEIPLLLAEARSRPGQIILAHRSKRSETAMFRTGYMAYKFFFRALTGRRISFGHFSVLPFAAVQRLVHMPESWNNLPAAIMRSRMRYAMTDTVRGIRHTGQSKMNFPGLIVHGLSAMSVYTDVIFVRVLLMMGGVSLLSLATLLAVLAIRFNSTLAIPGWATVVFGDLLIILFQAMLMIAVTSLMILAGRSARPMVPVVDAPVYVCGETEIRPDPHLRRGRTGAE